MTRQFARVGRSHLCRPSSGAAGGGARRRRSLRRRRRRKHRRLAIGISQLVSPADPCSPVNCPPSCCSASRALAARRSAATARLGAVAPYQTSRWRGARGAFTGSIEAQIEAGLTQPYWKGSRCSTTARRRSSVRGNWSCATPTASCSPRSKTKTVVGNLSGGHLLPGVRPCHLGLVPLWRQRRRGLQQHFRFHQKVTLAASRRPVATCCPRPDPTDLIYTAMVTPNPPAKRQLPAGCQTPCQYAVMSVAAQPAVRLSTARVRLQAATR
jgi:hypothetical protein